MVRPLLPVLVSDCLCLLAHTRRLYVVYISYPYVNGVSLAYTSSDILHSVGES